MQQSIHRTEETRFIARICSFDNALFSPVAFMGHLLLWQKMVTYGLVWQHTGTMDRWAIYGRCELCRGTLTFSFFYVLVKTETFALQQNAPVIHAEALRQLIALLFWIVVLDLLQHALVFWSCTHEWLIDTTPKYSSTGFSKNLICSVWLLSCITGACLLQIRFKRTDLVGLVGECAFAVPGCCCRIFRSAHRGAICPQTGRKPSAMPPKCWCRQGSSGLQFCHRASDSVAYLLCHFFA